MALMAAPVTPAESVGGLLDKEIENGGDSQRLEHPDEDDAATVKYELKQEDQDVNMVGSEEPTESNEDRQLQALEDALKAAGTEDFKPAFFAYGKALLTKYNCAPDFVKSLHDFFPKSDAIAYATQLPGNDADEFNLHLSDLSWLPQASTKPAPYLHTCLQLWDEITTNGFVTKGPLINEVCVELDLFPALVLVFACQSVLE